MKYFLYHQSRGHDTEDCYQFHDGIEEIIADDEMTRFTTNTLGGKEQQSRTTKRGTVDHERAGEEAPKAKTEKVRAALGFTDDEKVNGDPNGIFPLIISTNIHGHRVRGCLIDEGNPVDILYQNIIERLGLRRKNLKYCFGLEAIGLNKMNALPWG